MAVTLKYVVVRAPLGKADLTGSVEISDATTVLAVTDNGDGTVTVWYV